jgi:hypothetical protein
MTSAAEMSTHAVSAGFATPGWAAIAGRAHMSRDKNVKTIVDERKHAPFANLKRIAKTPHLFS